MRAGDVVRIRVNTEDVMSCIDLVEQSGVQTAGMSLAMYVRLALSALLQAARQEGIVPSRTGFEYQEMKDRIGRVSLAAKVKFSEGIHQREMARVAVDAPACDVRINAPIRGVQTKLTELNTNQEAMINRRAALYSDLSRLLNKREHDADNWDDTNAQELADVQQKFDDVSAALRDAGIL